MSPGSIPSGSWVFVTDEVQRPSQRLEKVHSASPGVLGVQSTFPFPRGPGPAGHMRPLWGQIFIAGSVGTSRNCLHEEEASQRERDRTPESRSGGQEGRAVDGRTERPPLASSTRQFNRTNSRAPESWGQTGRRGHSFQDLAENRGKPDWP